MSTQIKGYRAPSTGDFNQEQPLLEISHENDLDILNFYYQDDFFPEIINLDVQIVPITIDSDPIIYFYLDDNKMYLDNLYKQKNLFKTPLKKIQLFYKGHGFYWKNNKKQLLYGYEFTNQSPTVSLEPIKDQPIYEQYFLYETENRIIRSSLQEASLIERKKSEIIHENVYPYGGYFDNKKDPSLWNQRFYKALIENYFNQPELKFKLLENQEESGSIGHALKNRKATIKVLLEASCIKIYESIDYHYNQDSSLLNISFHRKI